MRFVLAPLAGFTDAPFRRLAYEGGAELTYTEMVSAAGLAHGSSPTRHLMEKMAGEGPLALQLFGSNERDLAFAARQADPQRFVEVNLNAGCPMTKVTREGAGAKLMEEPKKVGRLLKALVENTPLPVTLKTRLGPHPLRANVFDVLEEAEAAGVKGVCVHARFTSQMHGGPVHLGLLAEVVRQSRVPVTGNGSVVNAKSAAAMASTGVSALMVGRAALSNPSIFAELRGLAEAGARPSGGETCRKHLEYVLAFRDQLVRAFPNDRIPSPDGYASVKMHTHLFRYFNGLPGAARLRARLNTVCTIAEINDIIQGYGR